MAEKWDSELILSSVLYTTTIVATLYNTISLSALLWKQLKKLILIVGCYCNNLFFYSVAVRVLHSYAFIIL